jgi:hypothetical protein
MSSNPCFPRWRLSCGTRHRTVSTQVRSYAGCAARWAERGTRAGCCDTKSITMSVRALAHDRAPKPLRSGVSGCSSTWELRATENHHRRSPTVSVVAFRIAAQLHVAGGKLQERSLREAFGVAAVHPSRQHHTPHGRHTTRHRATTRMLGGTCFLLGNPGHIGHGT